MTVEQSEQFQEIINKVDRIRAASEKIAEYGRMNGVEVRPIERNLALTISEADFLTNLILARGER